MAVFQAGRPSLFEKPRGRRWTRLALIALLALAGLAGVALMVVVSYFQSLAAQFDLDKLGEMPQRSIVYDCAKREIGRLHGENRIIISVPDIPPFFVKAITAREDARFFKHQGIDVFGVLRALMVNTAAGELRQGASTITQQLARNSFPLGGQTLHRKMLEAMVARRIELQFSKEKILELYVNRIYFGAGVFGLETAARAYFGKHARELLPGECALLAGIIRSPNRFSPFRNLEGALGERAAVLNRMVDERMITRAEADAIEDTPVQVSSKPHISKQDNYMMDCVRRELDVIVGETYTGDGGLRIFTTLDSSLQAAAEIAVETRLAEIESTRDWSHPRRKDHTAPPGEGEQPTEYVQGAAVVLDNATGGVLAAVGGRDYIESKVNRALATSRQIGSAMKPFVYAAAFERGLLPGTFVSDDPIAPGEIASAPGVWTPGNSDNRHHGLQPAEVGLIRSRNTMSVRIGEMAGLTEVRRVATLAGVAPWVPPNPSVYLGALEASVKDAAAAYSVFANGGYRRQAYFIERVEDLEGRPVFLSAHIGLQAVEPGAAWLTHRCLEQVLKRGTAARAESLGLKVQAAGKTGTTNDFRDAWFVGYTTSLTCAVWVGMDYPEPIMYRGYGSTLALPIWVDIMNAAPPASYPAQEFTPPTPLLRTHVCRVTGALAVAGCSEAGTAYEIELPESRVPVEPCLLHSGVAGDGGEDKPNFLQRLFGRQRKPHSQPAQSQPYQEPAWADD